MGGKARKLLPLPFQISRVFFIFLVYENGAQGRHFWFKVSLVFFFLIFLVYGNVTQGHRFWLEKSSLKSWKVDFRGANAGDSSGGVAV